MLVETLLNNIDISSIIDMIIKILAIIVTIYILPKFKIWLIGKIGEDNARRLENLIMKFVIAAEQIYKNKPKSGSEKKEYVLECLVGEGIKTDGYVNNLIEAAVNKLNSKEENN